MPDLRIGMDRVRLYGVGLLLIGLSQLRFVKSVGHFWDWLDFYIAGAMAGTRALLDPAVHAAWGQSHNLPVTAFAYLPGFAWLLVPAAHVSLAWGFAINAVVMFAIAIGAALLAERVFQVERRLGVLSVIGWAPIAAAIVTGQNSPLGLLLWMLALLGFARNQDSLIGLAVGALCYKPTYALPFIVLLFVLARWRALGVVIGCGVVWYALSVSASGGDWLWPANYLRSLAAYVGPDFAYNRFKAISLPGVLMLAGLSHGLAFAIGMVMLVAGIALLRKMPALEAASLTGLIGIAASPHAWPYDAAIALPALWWVMTKIAEPWRTRIVVAAYAIAPLWLASNVLHFDPFAIVIIGGALAALAQPIRGYYLGSIITRST